MELAHDLTGPEAQPRGTAVDKPGRAPELVLVHGITESRRTWDPLVPALGASHLVLNIDLPGHGESPKSPAYDPVSLAIAVHDTVVAVGFTDPLLVGHSLGGVVVSACAGMFGCRGAVNVDQPLQLSAFQGALQAAAPMLQGTPEEFASFIAMLFASMDGRLPSAQRARIAATSRPDQDVVLAIWDSVLASTPQELDASVDALTSAIHVPYLSIHGIDPGPEYSVWLSSRVPTSTVEVWPDLGHYPHLVEPERFLARLTAFEQSLA